MTIRSPSDETVRKSSHGQARPEATKWVDQFSQRSGTGRMRALITVDVRTCRQWRAWLAKHHASSPGIWLVRHKQHTGVKSMGYEDLVRQTNVKAWQHFQALAPTYRRNFVVWIHITK
jgi:uncharacterized protein YdeI (YjbR/CyaY-like superfamily)